MRRVTRFESVSVVITNNHSFNIESVTKFSDFDSINCAANSYTSRYVIDDSKYSFHRSTLKFFSFLVFLFFSFDKVDIFSYTQGRGGRRQAGGQARNSLKHGFKSPIISIGTYLGDG